MKRRIRYFRPSLEQLEAELEREIKRESQKGSAVKPDANHAIPSLEELEKELEREINNEKTADDKKISDFPVESLEEELENDKYKRRYRQMVKSTVSTLIVVAAIAVLISSLFLPILRIYGSSMTPTLVNGNLVAAVRNGNYERGDIIAFYYNNKVLIKRVIGLPGEWVDIDEKGNVSINGDPISEPYIEDLALGECDIEFPYQVPDSRYFVMGDHRSVSSDSRNSQIGCISEELIVGKLIFRLWPIEEIGLIS